MPENGGPDRVPGEPAGATGAAGRGGRAPGRKTFEVGAVEKAGRDRGARNGAGAKR